MYWAGEEEEKRKSLKSMSHIFYSPSLSQPLLDFSETPLNLSSCSRFSTIREPAAPANECCEADGRCCHPEELPGWQKQSPSR